jgi:hypothetical protein
MCPASSEQFWGPREGSKGEGGRQLQPLHAVGNARQKPWQQRGACRGRLGWLGVWNEGRVLGEAAAAVAAMAAGVLCVVVEG